MSAQPPRFPQPPRFVPKRKQLPWQNTELKKRASVIFLSAFALVQCAPVLDRVFSPEDGGLFAAQPSTGVAYEFSVEPTGILRANCAEGPSRIELLPGDKTIRTAEGLFRDVTVRASLCTEFGFRKRQNTLLVPAELFKADSEVIQGTWETKTYTGVPSMSRPEETSTLQVRRLPDGKLEIAPLSNALEEPAFNPVQVSFNSPEEMAVVQNWRSGLLPLKDIRFEYEVPFLAKPIVLEGKLTQIRPVARSLTAAF
ncbi:MAG: hypothetical protein ACJ763_06950 [Bdellovibrionia bacterium]